MFIKEVTIDGFKSYAKKVVIRQFDPNFNAITGLNGTGKSNILDAICFALGMKRWADVRVNKIQELIYKQGQAGVTKATVSICFDNSDSERSPTGYEDKKEIIVTRTIHAGKDQFLINGQKAQAKRVHDMFHSIQLNMGNPHFLIMQGRITKVLNMKPAEILRLLAEASQTSMYDEKRVSALKTLQKKEKNLQEIDAYIEDSLVPALTEAREMKKAYLEWQEATAKFDSLDQLITAYKYWRLLNMKEKYDHCAIHMAEKIDACSKEKTELQERLKLKEAEIKETENQYRLMSGGKVKEVSEHCDKLGLQVAQLRGSHESKVDDVNVHKQECERITALLQEVSEEKVAAVMQQAEQKLAKSAEQKSAADADYESAKCEVAGTENGDGRDENNRSLPERLREAESEIKQQEAEIQRYTVAVAHVEKELASANQEAKQKLQEDAQLMKELKLQQVAVEKGEQAVAAVQLNHEEIEGLEQAAHQSRNAVRACTGKSRKIAADIGHILNFAFQDPTPGFDRRTVKGVLARLVRIKDPACATALEVAAGGKLNHIVVDTDKVGRDLLKNGGLKKRVTIVPLNKTKASVVSQQKRQQAQQSTADRATLALELVGYDKEVETAMQYAFGNAFVCQDKNAAQAVAFSKQIHCRGISLQGDDFSPAGTLTGGSRGHGTPVLTRIAELDQCEQELAAHQAELARVESELAKLEGVRKQHKEAVHNLEMARHALSLVEGRAHASAGHQAQQRVDALQTEMTEAKKLVDAANTKRAEQEAKADELRKKINLFQNDRGAAIAAAKKRLESCKKALSKCQEEHEAVEKEFNLKKAEMDCAAEERQTLTEQLSAAQAETATAEDAARTVQEKLDALTVEWKAAEEKSNKLKEGLTRYQEDVVNAKREKSDIENDLANLESEVKSHLKRKDKASKDSKDAQKAIEQAEKDKRHLVAEKSKLGQAGGRYDFASMDMARKEAEHKELMHSKEQKSMRTDKAALSRAELVEQNYKSLTGRRSTVQKDKERIEAVIEELDITRDSAMEKTWHQVNEKLNRIFAILLPGTAAKLVPPEGCDFKDGLEVKVAFGGVWKDSLSELSGGQRSLLTLSLILALLEFNPAPLYILDEVDAALDLSHTQNIGKLIHERFPNSQFIIVSLKEGMFNNANVLFRTSFVSGSSCVQRNARAGAGKSAAAQEAEADRPPPAKRGRAIKNRGENVPADL